MPPLSDFQFFRQTPSHTHYALGVSDWRLPPTPFRFAILSDAPSIRPAFSSDTSPLSPDPLKTDPPPTRCPRPEPPPSHHIGTTERAPRLYLQPSGRTDLRLLDEGIGNRRREEGRLTRYHGRPQPGVPDARTRHRSRHSGRLGASIHDGSRCPTRAKRGTRSEPQNSRCRTAPTRGPETPSPRRRSRLLRRRQSHLATSCPAPRDAPRALAPPPRNLLLEHTSWSPV